jgi:hypothetical protein
MKIYDILKESNDRTDEGPVRYLKRTLAKNTGMGKAAQLDVEIEKEAKKIFTDFYAVAKNSPSGKMTVKGLADVLTAKGFVNKPSQVIAYLQQDPTLGMKLKSAGKSIKKGFNKVKQTMQGKDTGLGQKQQNEPDLDVPKGTDKLKVPPPKKNKKQKQKDKGGNFGKKPHEIDNTDQFNSIQREFAEQMMYEADVELSKGQAMNAIKKFVQQGMQSNVKAGNANMAKSKYADAQNQPAGNLDKATINNIAKLKKMGYSVTSPDGKKV